MPKIINISTCSWALFTIGLVTSSFDADWAYGAAFVDTLTATLTDRYIKHLRNTVVSGHGFSRAETERKGAGFSPAIMEKAYGFTSSRSTTPSLM
jgi:hypothetical protein